MSEQEVDFERNQIIVLEGEGLREAIIREGVERRIPLLLTEVDDCNKKVAEAEAKISGLVERKMRSLRLIDELRAICSHKFLLPSSSDQHTERSGMICQFCKLPKTDYEEGETAEGG